VAGLVAALAAAAAWMAAGRLAAPVRRARAVNRDFIADAAHELRTPLAIIQASAGHALSRERANNEYRESLSEILSATERAGASVGELLEFARLEAGQATPRLAPLRLDLLVEEVAASTRVDGTIIESIPGEAVVVEADYNLLRQVVDNITRNAAARSDKVVLTTHLDQRSARVEIADDGPGFDPGIIDHVFERFRRGDRSGSVGLGMAIARTIVELHGGTCSAANNPDGGALVTVELPYKAT
jgi:two-component system OmpR family sensor kinase